jgi:predicted enzyme related to lactoylglutathione lyase
MINQTKGVLWDTTALNGTSWTMFYVHVEDIDESVEKAAKLGAKVLVPFTDNGAIEFAHLEDLDGNRFGVWRPKSR